MENSYWILQYERRFYKNGSVFYQAMESSILRFEKDMRFFALSGKGTVVPKFSLLEDLKKVLAYH